MTFVSTDNTGAFEHNAYHHHHPRSSPSIASEKAAASRRHTEKLQSIMTFLDEESRISLSDDAKDKLLKKSVRKICKAEVDRCDVEATPMPNFLDEQESLILNLRLQLNRETEKALQAGYHAEEMTKKRLRQQRELYEKKLRILQAHVVQLEDEKKMMGDRCETLAFELKQCIVKSEQRLSEQNKRNQDTLKNAKIQWETAEKVRMQKWKSQRVQEIKESTLKSVEPEIQRILDLHKDEIRQMRGHFEEHAQQSDARAEQRYIEKLAEVEAAVAQRIENVRCQERDLAARVLTEKLSERQKQFSLEMMRKEEETKVSMQIFNERTGLQTEEIGRLQQEGQEQRMLAVSAEQKRFTDEISQLEARHKKELKKHYAEVEDRFCAWKSDFRNEQEQTKFRENLNENQKNRQDDLEQRLFDALKETDRLEKEKRTICENTREHYAGRIAELEELTNRLKVTAGEKEKHSANQIGMLKAQADVLKREHDLALETINERVHGLLEKKNAKIEMLRQQLVQFHPHGTPTGTGPGTRNSMLRKTASAQTRNPISSVPSNQKRSFSSK
ncbi:putative Centrosomal protein of 131 kDa [Hypsibius exemplaris]|uniref:Centrosomal protein of 131 kDa n=1 Tax=Hypsibius exemplaris TaxID=2072580 RepID=A0A1W0WP01_HYPEX|nr:putative Centrosomal protein of 131 kDa [Hypsibius exemplaris]